MTLWAFAAALKLRPNEDGKLVLKKRTTILEVFCGENHSASNAIRELIANQEKLNFVTELAEKCAHRKTKKKLDLAGFVAKPRGPSSRR